MTLTGHKDQVRGVAFSPAGDTLATASFDQTIKLWALSRPDETTLRVDPNPLTLTGHTHWVNQVVFSPAGTRLASAGTDKAAIIWDVQSGRLLDRFEHPLDIGSVGL